MTHAPKDPRQLRREVVVFGAGIAGLTAAHELIERGFRVEVFEPSPPSPVDKLDQLSTAVCGIGGKARTQWTRTERPQPHVTAARLLSTDPIAELPDEARRIDFKPKSVELSADAKKVLAKVADFLTAHPQIRHLEVRGFSDQHDARPYAGPPRSLDYQRAATVVQHLITKHDIEGSRLEAAGLGLGHAGDWTKSDASRNFVSLRVLEDWIPGEHGFRFFPSYYRNLFDTLRRIPIANAQDVYLESGRTVLDNIVPTKIQRVGLDRAGLSFEFPRRPAASAQELFDYFRNAMKSLGFTVTDIAHSQMKLFKYMTSCPERRSEYERLSWWAFVDGERLSKRFQTYLDALGQVLVSMTAHQCDARSYGNSSVQLQLDQMLNRQPTDGTLNGPTSQAWFDHWRRYLERQGVEFHRGTLDDLIVVDEQTVWPVVRLFENGEPRDAKTVLVRDYCVLAVGESTLQQLIGKNPKLRGGDFDRLMKLPLGKLADPKPDGAHAHMSGIQFYFESDVRFVEGHTIYPDSEWGLSSISQPQFWTRRRGWWSGYRGVVSVDICDWFTKSTKTGKAAWDSTKEEIAHEVWRQVKTTLIKKVRHTLPDPVFYHLDEGIVFGTKGDRAGLPVTNKTPFLMTRTGEFSQRPGDLGAYKLQLGSVVLAGNFMQTYTRLTTMEASNESARHAVNAILDASDFDGDRCAVLNPEDNELPDFRYLLELDRRLHEMGLPHFMDILDLREIPAALLRPDPDFTAVGLTTAHLAASAAEPKAPSSNGGTHEQR